MRLYGEIKSGALEHLASKVIGYTADRRDRKNASADVAQSNNSSRPRVRVWDEERGAYFLQDE
jgi:hypothetical protein